MQQTYQEAINKVFQDEGGYSNDIGDPGGPTNWGITIEDVRMYWKPDATALDVKNMPKSVAEDIYVKHYATPINYNALPPGVDYTVLDYAINSGISRSVRTLQGVVGTNQDGLVGRLTLDAVSKAKPEDIINGIYDARLRFLRSLGTWSRFGRGWLARCTSGRVLALNLCQKYQKKTSVPVVNMPTHTATTVAVGTGAVATVAVSKGVALVPVLICLGIVGILLVVVIEIYRRKQNVLAQN